MNLAEVQQSPYSQEQLHTVIDRITQYPLLRMLLLADGPLLTLIRGCVRDSTVLQVTTRHEEILKHASFASIDTHDATLLLRETNIMAADTLIAQQRYLLVMDRLQDSGIPLLPSPTLATLFEFLPLRRRVLEIQQVSEGKSSQWVRDYRLESTCGPVALVTDRISAGIEQVLLDTSGGRIPPHIAH